MRILKVEYFRLAFYAICRAAREGFTSAVQLVNTHHSTLVLLLHDRTYRPHNSRGAETSINAVSSFFFFLLQLSQGLVGSKKDKCDEDLEVIVWLQQHFL